MSCFWDSLLNSLNKEDCVKLNLIKKTPKHLANRLKGNSKVNLSTKCQGNLLTKKQLEENKLHIDNYDVNSVNDGYLCSTCDPFLLLFCEILSIDIHHKYLNNMVIYSTGSNRIEYFKSNKGHIQYIKKKILKSVVDKNIFIGKTSKKKIKNIKKIPRLPKKIIKIFRKKKK